MTHTMKRDFSDEKVAILVGSAGDIDGFGYLSKYRIDILTEEDEQTRLILSEGQLRMLAARIRSFTRQDDP